MNPIDTAELELQEELREMFAVDTAQQLQSYFQLVQNLNGRSWVADIQNLYRGIHTIKGGAVTVSADAMLYAATVLENLLSDLRYLEVAPSLDDRKLRQILLEAGELIGSTIAIEATGDRAKIASQPAVDRLEQLHAAVKELYLPDWSELRQIHQEFAEEGFDLVILDLEMAIESIPADGITQNLRKIARTTIAQLTDIGKDIQLATGWDEILDRCQAVIEIDDPQIWLNSYPKYFHHLKESAKNSGEPIDLFEDKGLSDRNDDDKSNDSFSAADIITDLAASIPTKSPQLNNAIDSFFDDEFATHEQADIITDLAASIPTESPQLNNAIDSFFDDEFATHEQADIVADLAASIPTESPQLNNAIDSFFDDEFATHEQADIITDLAGSIPTESPQLNNAIDSFFDDAFATYEQADIITVLAASILTESPQLNNAIDSFFDDAFATYEQADIITDLAGSIPTESPQLNNAINSFFDDAFATYEQADIVADFIQSDRLSLEIDRYETTIQDATPDLPPEERSIEVTYVDEFATQEQPLTGDLSGLVDEFFADKLPADKPSPTADISELVDGFFTDGGETSTVFFYTDSHGTSEETQNDLEVTEPPTAKGIDAIPRRDTGEPSGLFPALLDNFFGDESIDYDASLDLDTDEIDMTEIHFVGADLSAVADVDLPDAVILPTTPEPATSEPKRNIQIAVPLERLDRVSQQAIDSLLGTRAVMNSARQFNQQLAQLQLLMAESDRSIGRLRELQDNYAMMQDANAQQNSTTDFLSLERYRQGYTTIAHLLENLLRLSELGREMEIANHQNTEDLQQLDLSIIHLKDEIETSRLVPFSQLALKARAIFRDLIVRYGKNAELIVHNDRLELDAGIVHQLEPALLHLLRNAYDHGLETAPERLAVGKPPQGKIELAIERRGNRYHLTMKDDGKGIDRSKIAQIASAKNFPLTDTSDDRGLLAVLCQPGFSSSSEVSDLSGRGVGMDVVVAQINAMGGKLDLITIQGQGTTFILELPAPQMLVSCILLRVGNRQVAIPSEEIVATALLDTLSPQAAAPEAIAAWQLQTDDGKALGFDLADYWPSVNSQPDRAISELAIALKVRSSKVWSIADELIGRAELSISPLPSPLVPPVGFLGVSLQPDGKLISVLDPTALTAAIADNRTHRPALPVISQPDVSNRTAKSILIVDDAALMRRRLEASLKHYGYDIATCSDGVEALAWLQTHGEPDLMITDVEMPNMDGFTLIGRLRQSGQDFPILVVSSRTAEDWVKEARRLGANDYLNKGFTTNQLIEKVESFLVGVSI